jgi:hypothetical protein
MTKLMVVFCNFVNIPKNCLYQKYWQYKEMPVVSNNSHLIHFTGWLFLRRYLALYHFWYQMMPHI